MRISGLPHCRPPRLLWVVVAWVVLILSAGSLGALTLAAQTNGPGRGPNISLPTNGNTFNPAQVARGEKAFAEQCGSCHGANGRGGRGKADMDLMRSPMVLDDLGGREIGEFLKYGRPGKNMPKFDLSPELVADIAAFLHKEIATAAEWQTYQKPSKTVGNAKAGEAFFNGPVGRCNTCHSAEGDMKGLAARQGDDVPAIQQLIIDGRPFGGRGRGGPPLDPKKFVPTATVTTKGGEVSSGLVFQITDFLITIRLDSGTNKSFVRQGNWPKVTVVNPLQAHVDLLSKYTDANIHDLAAYLTGLK